MMNCHIYMLYSSIISNFLAQQAAFTRSGGTVLQGNLVLQYFQVLQCCSIVEYCRNAVFPNNAGMQYFHRVTLKRLFGQYCARLDLLVNKLGVGDISMKNYRKPINRHF